MAFKVKNKKFELQDKYAVAMHSEQHFCKSVVASARAGYIKKTATQVKNYEVTAKFVNRKKDVEILTNTDNSQGKMRVVFGCGDSLSPLQEQTKSSERVRAITEQLEVAKKITKAEHDEFGTVSGDIKPFLLTLTVPNFSKNTLKFESSVFRDRVSKFIKSLDDGARRANGLQLVGDGIYLGGLVSFELTLNKEAIFNKSSHNLYNYHAHFLILADDDIDVDATKDILFAKWQSLNTNKSINKKAFDLKRAESSKKADATTSAVLEVVKYAVKPSDWSLLDKIENDVWQQQVFAEVYNSLKNTKRKRVVGLLYDASEFLSMFSDFSNAISFSSIDSFPEISTQLSKLYFDNKKNKYSAAHVRELTAEEIIFYNRNLLKNVLVSDDLADEINDYFSNVVSFNDKKKDLFMAVFKDYCFINSVDSLLNKLRDLANDAMSKKLPGKCADIKLLADSIQENVVYYENVTVFSKSEAQDSNVTKIYKEYNFADGTYSALVERTRQRDFLLANANSHIKAKQKFSDDFADFYKQNYGKLDADFSKINNKLGLDISFAQTIQSVELFVRLDVSAEEFFNEKFEVSASNAMPKNATKVA